MSITLIGLMFLPLCVIFWRTPRRLLDLILIGSAFNAAAVIVAGGFGVPPNLVPTALFAGFVAIRHAFGTRYPAERQVMRILTPFIILGGWALLSSILLPRLFAGRILVWPQKIVTYFALTPLEPNFGNITQDLYLLAAFSLAICAALYFTRAGLNLARVLNVYFVAGFVVIAIAMWQFLSNSFGVWFPAAFFLSNPGWSLLSNQSMGSYIRLNGSFSEPSALAGYLSGSFGASGWVVLHGHKNLLARVLFVASLGAIIMSTATTGYAAVLMLATVAIVYALFKGAAALRRRVTKIAAAAAVAAGLLAVIVPVASPKLANLATTVLNASLSKDQSASYADRTSTDRDSINEMLESDGLGVGWGSNRSSSLVPGTLAAVGLPGAVLILWFLANLIRHVTIPARIAVSEDKRMAMQGAAGGLAGMLCAAIISGPTLTQPDFYLLLALLIGTAARVRFEAKLPAHSTPSLAARPAEPQMFPGAAPE